MKRYDDSMTIFEWCVYGMIVTAAFGVVFIMAVEAGDREEEMRANYLKRMQTKMEFVRGSK